MSRYWRKYVHEVLVNRLGGLSLPRKSVVRLTDRPDMTLDVYRGRKTTIQQQQRLISQGSWVGYPVWQNTFVSPSAFQEGQLSVTGKSMCTKYWLTAYEVLLPRKSVVRLTDRPDMTSDVYRGRKTTTQQQQQSSVGHCNSSSIFAT